MNKTKNIYKTSETSGNQEDLAQNLRSLRYISKLMPREARQKALEAVLSLGFKEEQAKMVAERLAARRSNAGSASEL
jgi:hypothetical protein